MQRRFLLALSTLALAATLAAGPAAAQAGKDFKIALLTGKTGPLEAYAKQTVTGFMMGLEYATGGTMAVAGRRIVVIEKDDQGKPDIGKAQLAAAYADDKVDIAVGTTGSPVALAMLPVATLERGHWGLNVALVPPLKDRLYGAVSFQLKFRLEK